jgi:putative endonuclease
VRAFVPASQWQHAGHLRGLWGERLALAYLTACGWDIEAHRYRAGRHDVDLIARRGSLVAFVEVKTRRTALCGTPVGGSAAEAVHWRKRRAISRVAECWRVRMGRRTDRYRFDLVTVIIGAAGRTSIEHLPDAWRHDW